MFDINKSMEIAKVKLQNINILKVNWPGIKIILFAKIRSSRFPEILVYPK